jgi:hypothetical protein
MGDVIEQLWRFARGDLEPKAFEEWLYAHLENPDLVELLGREFVLTLLEHDYGTHLPTTDLRDVLQDRLRVLNPMKCRCLGWRNHEVLRIGYDAVTESTAVLEDYFDYSIEARQTPWLECVRCRNCGQDWYLAVDTIDDWYHLVRLDSDVVEAARNGAWPSDFDDLEVFWPSEEWLARWGYSSLEDWRKREAI